MELARQVNTHSNNDHDTFSKSIMKAGTGYMICLCDTIRTLQAKGYIENLVPNHNHFTCWSGKVKFYPKDITIDEMVRFENSSDPADQAILYAISCKSQNMKGLYVDSYGVYCDDLSREMIEKLKECPRC